MALCLQNSPNFEILRDYLRSNAFNESSICGLLGIDRLDDLIPSQYSPAKESISSGPLRHLTRLFLLGESFPRAELESGLSAPVVKALEGLGLASLDSGSDTRLFCPVALYPFGPLYIVSDRWLAPAGSGLKFPEDFVYPAISPNTWEFIDMLPVTPCDRFLELCSGTGAVALAAAAYARKAWAIDITARATHMAEFNRLLNGLNNVTVLKGDLFEGAENLEFDRIVAHPPYMPVLHPDKIFYDGGADGEQITRRIIAGLPNYLKPGGCFYCLAQASDRKGALLEDRVRGWLGEGQADFDVAILELLVQEPKDAAFRYALQSRKGFETVNLMRENLARLGVESIAYGWIIVQRKYNGRKAFTVRRAGGRRTGREEIAWLLKWETFAAGPSAFDDLLGTTPCARDSLELRTIHKMKDGELVPEQLALHAENPFAMDCRVDPWVAFLIPLCDGKTTVRQLWEKCKAHNFIHAETSPEEFAKFVGVLISGGFLAVAEYLPPDSP